MSLLPDQFHIDRIRSALWHGREFGRAAVMVGAGLSLNARPTSVSAPSFPTWSGLTNRLVDELYPEQSSACSTRENVLVQARSTSGALRLAEEYQAAFGRDALDRLIITAVPDASYEPSPLHSLLLRLPWSDVFTTNYDTLLERAARGLVDRKYDVVRTAAEVPGSARPRIVKLHGSFPSNRPFILTEEDFRTYPDRFAPLVNLTQQAMMENAFCLLGFSGDDPNFLHWSGWVRDNLGRSSPTIYLCGLLDLNSPRRKLLYDRNVIPIDLATLFPPNTPNRHAVALEWFLKTLDEGRWLPLPRKWPYRRENPNARGNAPEGMLEVPKPSFPWFTDEELYPQNSHMPLDLEAAVKLLASWRVTRESYPGWVVAPADNRDRVWIRTDSWLDYLLKNLSRLPIGGQILLLYELNWRMEICLVPLWPDLVVRISEVLRSINPFPGSVELPGAADKLDPESLKLLPMSELPRLWVELAHACLRSSRESQDEENFEFWRSLLNHLATDHTGLTSRIRFQECLFFLGRLDHLNVRIILNAWTTGEEDPFWLIRRAAILVELGELEEAEERAETGLRAIREGIRPEEDDMAMMSREGWAMKLVDAIRRARSGRPFFPDREFTGRWERLAERGCNPNPELEILKERLKRPMPFVQRVSEIVYSFDLGKASRNHRSGPSLLDQMLPALQATRLVEDAAYPPKCGSWKLSEDLLATSSTWMRHYWPSIATSLILRLSDKKKVEKHFDRNTVAVLPDATVLALHQMLVGSLDHAIGALSSVEALAGEAGRKVAVELVEVAVELLSRLVVRLPEELALKELRRAMSLYRSPALAAEHRLTDCLNHLISRSIRALDTGPLSSCVLELFSLPIPGVDGFAVADVQRWPEPASSLGQLSLKVVRGENSEDWSRMIQWLIRIIPEVSGEGRLRASWRMTVLWEKQFLTSTEVDQFAAAIWAVRGLPTGLPAPTMLNFKGLLSLPEPEAKISLERVKAYCLSSDFVPLCTPITQPDGKIVNQFNFGTDTGEFLDEIIRVTRPRSRKVDRVETRWVEWNRQDLTRIFDKLSNWWQGEGKGLITGPHRDLIYDQIIERQGKILRTIWSILLPRCRRGDKFAVIIRDLILEFDSAGLPVTTAFPPLLRLFPELLDETVRRIRQGLYSRDEEPSGQAMGALFIVICLGD